VIDDQNEILGGFISAWPNRGLAAIEKLLENLKKLVKSTKNRKKFGY
jgi:hypothetical protein